MGGHVCARCLPLMASSSTAHSASYGVAAVELLRRYAVPASKIVSKPKLLGSVSSGHSSSIMFPTNPPLLHRSQSLPLHELKRIVLPVRCNKIDASANDDDESLVSTKNTRILEVSSNDEKSHRRRRGRSASLTQEKDVNGLTECRRGKLPLIHLGNNTRASSKTGDQGSMVSPRSKVSGISESAEFMLDYGQESLPTAETVLNPTAGAGCGRRQNPFVAHEDHDMKRQWERRWLEEDPTYMSLRMRGLQHHIVQKRLCERAAYTESSCSPSISANSKSGRRTAAALPNQQFSTLPVRRGDRNQLPACVQSLRTLQRSLGDSTRSLLTTPKVQQQQQAQRAHGKIL
mmetsp:Transcript_53353/g.106108  ORF Transcript_53353/g.106108 Transcript_53353/m.106108 type:complete len:346 (-) Transcript_53353:122-1159(-)